MALADWDVFISNVGLGLSINVITPIVSLGSGRIGGTLGGGTNTAVINVTDASLREKGVTVGKLRSLIRYDDFTAAGQVGFSFMQSVADLTGAGDFYKVHLLQTDGKLYLSKNTATTISSTETVLASLFFSPGIDTVFALEAEWIVDIGELGGVALFVRTGYETDFSDLTTVISYLDVSSPLTTSVAESLFVVEASAGGIFNVDFDQTALFIPA